MLETTFAVTAPLVLAYFVLINTSYLVLVVVSAVEFRGHMDRKDTRRQQTAGELTPGVSVIVPAFNEEALIVSSVRALLALRYAQHEVVVVDDGSTDGTLRVLTDAFDLVPVPTHHPGEIPVGARVGEVLVPRNGRTRLVVVTKTNSGRSEAVNVGVNTARESLVAIIDADSILEPDALVRVTQAFIDDPGRVVAAGGTVRAINGSTVQAGRIVRLRMPRSWLARAQVVEYLRSFLIGRTGWASMGTLLLISGAFGVYRRDVVIEAGGLDPDSIGEDFELCLRVHKMMRDQRPRLPRRLRARAGVLDRGAEHPGRAAPPADPLAPRPLGDAVGLPGHALPAPVRAGRLGRAALLLALRAVRPADRGGRARPGAPRGWPSAWSTCSTPWSCCSSPTATPSS